jgi:hypothetical protein
MDSKSLLEAKKDSKYKTTRWIGTKKNQNIGQERLWEKIRETKKKNADYLRKFCQNTDR